MTKPLIALVLLVPLLLAGCGDQAYLEDQQISLLIGMDLKEDKKLLIYSASPVFRREATKKVIIVGTEAVSSREARKKMDTMATGSLGGGKIQSYLIGKKLIQHKELFPYLDPFLRDPKNEINGHVIVVDGRVKDILYMDYQNKGRIGVVIKEMIDSTYESRSTVKVSLQQLHRQITERAMTPYLPLIKKRKNDPVVAGIAFLDKKGKYADQLDNEKSSLFLMMKGVTGKPIPLTLNLDNKIKGVKPAAATVSLNVGSIKRKVHLSKQGGKFAFDIDLKLGVSISELPFQFDVKKRGEELEKALEDELKEECNKLVKRWQQKRLDPLGLGMYIRAYQYNDWKKIEKDWLSTISQATVTFSPHVKMMSNGVSK